MMTDERNAGCDDPAWDPPGGSNAAAPGVEIVGLDFQLGDRQVLFDVTLSVPAGGTMALIGPSGSGKTSLLRCINRMNEGLAGARWTAGSICVGGVDVRSIEPGALRRRVATVFSSPVTFPLSIRENVAFALLGTPGLAKKEMTGRIEEALRLAGLWDEVKDRLQADARVLSEGQQQRLCIARAIAVRPLALLLDEPCGALDPGAAARIEEALHGLAGRMTILLATHDLQHAARCSDTAAFFLKGRLVECGQTRTIFMTPNHPLTEAYLTSRLGQEPRS